MMLEAFNARRYELNWLIYLKISGEVMMTTCVEKDIRHSNLAAAKFGTRLSKQGAIVCRSMPPVSARAVLKRLVDIQYKE